MSRAALPARRGRRALWLAGAIALAACSGEAPEKTVFDGQTSALDKAASVNDTVEAAAAAQRRAIDEQSQ